MKTRIIIVLLFLCFVCSAQTLPKVASGTIVHLENFKSHYTDSRNVDIWLPKGYDATRKYAVLYMHDGQMLFESTQTLNHHCWNVDAVLTKLLQEKKIQNMIVVGIWNGGKTRHSDYFPQKPFESLSPEQKDYVNKQLQTAIGTTEIFKPTSDNYLKFLVKELKPYIDKKYSVYKDPTHTFIAGSSMGGLISIYAICEYPKVFSGAACMSTHWPCVYTVEGNPFPDAFVKYLKANLPDPKKHKIYFDYGDKTLDAMYAPLQKKVDELMKAKSFTAKNWMTKFYPGDDHSEKSWYRRLNIPMEFLLGKEQKK
jgi:predicted alpha/beta superfamily hydrolase